MVQEEPSPPIRWGAGQHVRELRLAQQLPQDGHDPRRVDQLVEGRAPQHAAGEALLGREGRATYAPAVGQALTIPARQGIREAFAVDLVQAGEGPGWEDVVHDQPALRLEVLPLRLVHPCLPLLPTPLGLSCGVQGLRLAGGRGCGWRD